MSWVRSLLDRRHLMRCPSCDKRGFSEWHEELPGLKRGGRWCPTCNYGVSPPVSPPVPDVTINMPPGLDAQGLVDAIEKYGRRNGQGWR